MGVFEKSVKATAEKIAWEFKGLSSEDIGSPGYAVKGASIGALVTSLSRLHPRWSAEAEKILPLTEDNSHLLEEGENPHFWIFEYIEELAWNWRAMKADRPTADSLARGLTSVPRSLSALCRVAENTLTA